ncbi:Glycosyl transferase family 2 [Loktanella sp. DSM 29012]|uniref:glycosyltransferase family 2 protein n=1 Tax=Loktanella sp. DSM 29012 TaxID=1881056 RepID=UPI0008B0E7B3|nr:glycosyltransferase [Loktanella sp. DSM 29012]SEQ78403.1 Glycosyl transferase family 2 [Loktanella sp. DSM 29012]
MNVDTPRPPAASVVITTHDRDDELATCLASLQRQTIPLEIIVMDDKGSAATRDLVARIASSARYLHAGTGQGPAFQRNAGIAAASCEIVFSFDDDVELVDPTTCEKTLPDFADPQVAAIGIPFVNVRISQEVHHVTAHPRQQLHAFVGAAHAVRRSAFQQVGGFRAHYFYMGEEGDLAIRLLDHGHEVRAGTAPPMHHFESPRRSSRRAAICGRKNDVLFVMHNVPMPQAIVHLAGTIVNGLRFGLRHGHAGWHLRGLAQGLSEAWQHRRDRRPVSAACYRDYRALKRGSAGAALAWTAKPQP